MVTEDDARAFALDFPDTVESSHMGTADFRVRGRVFATFPRPRRRLDPAEQAAVLGTAPAVFEAAAGAWGRQGWTLVELDGIERDELRELVIGAWRHRAPKRLLAAYDAAQ